MSNSGAPSAVSMPHIVARFPGGWNGAGGMVHIYNRALHQQAADWYVPRYYAEHGEWPSGGHRFTVRHGKGEGFDVQTPIGNSSGTRHVSMIFEVYSHGLPASVTRSNLNGLLYVIPRRVMKLASANGAAKS